MISNPPFFLAHGKRKCAVTDLWSLSKWLMSFASASVQHPLKQNRTLYDPLQNSATTRSQSWRTSGNTPPLLWAWGLNADNPQTAWQTHERARRGARKRAQGDHDGMLASNVARPCPRDRSERNDDWCRPISAMRNVVGCSPCPCPCFVFVIVCVLVVHCVAHSPLRCISCGRYTRGIPNKSSISIPHQERDPKTSPPVCLRGCSEKNRLVRFFSASLQLRCTKASSTFWCAFAYVTGHVGCALEDALGGEPGRMLEDEKGVLKQWHSVFRTTHSPDSHFRHLPCPLLWHSIWIPPAMSHTPISYTLTQRLLVLWLARVAFSWITVALSSQKVREDMWSNTHRFAALVSVVTINAGQNEETESTVPQSESGICSWTQFHLYSRRPEHVSVPGFFHAPWHNATEACATELENDIGPHILQCTENFGRSSAESETAHFLRQQEIIGWTTQQQCWELMNAMKLWLASVGMVAASLCFARCVGKSSIASWSVALASPLAVRSFNTLPRPPRLKQPRAAPPHLLSASCCRAPCLVRLWCPPPSPCPGDLPPPAQRRARLVRPASLFDIGSRLSLLHEDVAPCRLKWGSRVRFTKCVQCSPSTKVSARHVAHYYYSDENVHNEGAKKVLPHVALHTFHVMPDAAKSGDICIYGGVPCVGGGNQEIGNTKQHAAACFCWLLDRHLLHSKKRTSTRNSVLALPGVRLAFLQFVCGLCCLPFRPLPFRAAESAYS